MVSNQATSLYSITREIDKSLLRLKINTSNDLVFLLHSQQRSGQITWAFNMCVPWVKRNDRIHRGPSIKCWAFSFLLIIVLALRAMDRAPRQEEKKWRWFQLFYKEYIRNLEQTNPTGFEGVSIFKLCNSISFPNDATQCLWKLT